MNYNDIKDSIILHSITGSQLYGTTTPESDTDEVGIFIAPKEYYLGLERVDEIDCSVVSKQANGKNDKDAEDIKFYEFKNICKLMSDGNPNCIELLFTKNHLIGFRDVGLRLLDNYELFVSQKIRNRFVGYAVGQLHKAKTKPDNFKDLQEFAEAYEVMESKLRRETVSSFKFIPYVSLSRMLSYNGTNVSIGGLNFNPSVKISKVYEKVKTRLEKASHRQDMWSKYGCDVKFLMHCVRLIFEGKELLTTGKIEFPLKDRELLLNIRNGNFDLKEVHEMIEQEKNALDNMTSDLPLTPDRKKLNKFIIETVEEFWDTDRTYP
jgi:predicted nucleotidyltransferase